ncbi:MAG: hypothetical protein KDC68_05395 [Gelidibacter sp.]|nr:hypothetical protein [Gelidibacter sp.]
MEQNRTNKEILVKGLQNMAISLALMFLGPSLLYLAFSNQEKSTYYLVLIIALIVCGLAIFFAFKGLKLILDSMFKN